MKASATTILACVTPIGFYISLTSFVHEFLRKHDMNLYDQHKAAKQMVETLRGDCTRLLSFMEDLYKLYSGLCKPCTALLLMEAFSSKVQRSTAGTKKNWNMTVLQPQTREKRKPA